MTKVISKLFFILTISWAATAQTGNGVYRYTTDLSSVTKDQVFVTLTPPAISQNEIVYYFPKIIPGTYAIEDYGRYISELQAFDSNGKALPVEKTEVNGWKISNATSLAKITYWVEDSFDSDKQDPEIFWPARTNIEEDVNFLINSSGFFGYFEGMKQVPFELEIIRPKELYGVTGLIPVEAGKPVLVTKKKKQQVDPEKRRDVFRTDNYDQLVDSPLMYAAPDTAVIRVANAEVIVGTYSPNKMINSKEIAAGIEEVLMAQSEFLGGRLPVDKYAFIFYFTDQPVYRYGALEHSYSSVYYMPEMTIEEMEQQLRDFSAHEFFHIVTPLTIHSKEIDEFDFNDPKMSRHLWMYEGVTEYFAGLVQVRYGLIGPEDYLQMVREKMEYADMFNDTLSFTELSRYTLDTYHEEYDNVYQKGALIGLCLDLELLKLSGGKYDLQDLMLELSGRYGKSKPFEDTELFDVIASMTYPEIREFFRRHVEGGEPLPLKRVFGYVGLQYDSVTYFENYSLGLSNETITIAEDGKNRGKLIIRNKERMDDMGQALGFENGDILLKINNRVIPNAGPGPELGIFIQDINSTLPETDTLRYLVLRTDVQGVEKEIELAAKVEVVQIPVPHALQFTREPSPDELLLLRAWLTP